MPIYEPTDCPDACDADDDGDLDIADPLWILGYLFLNGEAPPPPSPFPGEDTTPDLLECGRTA